MNFRRRTIPQAVAAAAIAVVALVAGQAVAGAQTRAQTPNPGMERMHELMQDGNPGMAQMHQQMMQNEQMMQHHRTMTAR